MQAIEFESVVQDRAIPLPHPHKLSPGQSVRVVVLYEELAMTPPREDEMSHISAQLSAESGGRLATLQPYPDAVPDSSGEEQIHLPRTRPPGARSGNARDCFAGSPSRYPGAGLVVCRAPAFLARSGPLAVK